MQPRNISNKLNFLVKHDDRKQNVYSINCNESYFRYMLHGLILKNGAILRYENRHSSLITV